MPNILTLSSFEDFFSFLKVGAAIQQSLERAWAIAIEADKSTFVSLYFGSSASSSVDGQNPSTPADPNQFSFGIFNNPGAGSLQNTCLFKLFQEVQGEVAAGVYQPAILPDDFIDAAIEESGVLKEANEAWWRGARELSLMRSPGMGTPGGADDLSNSTGGSEGEMMTNAKMRLRRLVEACMGEAKRG